MIIVYVIVGFVMYAVGFVSGFIAAYRIAKKLDDQWRKSTKGNLK